MFFLLTKHVNCCILSLNKDKIIWLEKQIEELIPFKQQCLILNEQVNKLSSEVDIYKNKIEISTKIKKENEEVFNLKIQKIKEFIKQNCPNKYDEFKLICQNFNFESK